MSVFRRPIHHLHRKPTTSIYRHLTTITTSSANHPPPDRPNSAYYDSLVQSAAQVSDFNLLRRVLSDRIYDGCFNTTDTFKFLTGTPNSLSLLPKLLESLSLLPRGLPRKNALDSLIARLCKLRLPEVALNLFDEMRQRNLEFSPITFHPILNALAHSRQLPECRRLLRLMKGLNAPPDTTAYNYLLTALCVDGDTASAAGLLETMQSEGLAADSRTYDAMVLGACRAGRVDGAVALMRAALAEKVAWSMLYSTPVHVVTALMERGYYGQAVKLAVACGEGRDRMLGSECCGVLASRLVKVERLEEAMFVLGEMDKRGFKMGPKLRDFYNLHSSG